MQGIGNMGMKRSYQFGIGILLCGVIVLAAVWTAVAMVNPAAPLETGRADVVVIDSLKSFGPLERPSVLFYHDKHTDALVQQNKDCSACHKMVNGKLSQKFMRVEDSAKETVMAIYHEQCIKCHEQRMAPDKVSGPVTCGGCHIKNAAAQRRWQPIKLDKSLHYRHVKANAEKCENCHHEYNTKTKKLFYAKGQESACLYCHKQVTEENRISNQLAAHQQCISCHRALTAKDKNAGPMQCGGCHDPKQQALIEKIADVPRMVRNQPDAVLVKTGLTNDNPDAVTHRMPSVPFNHKAHEGYTNSCQVCHHAGLKSCATCHTVQGTDEGKQVKLAQAMHQSKAQSSCIGCHNQKQAEPACAGCHSSIPERRVLTNEAACKTCHSAPTAGNPNPLESSEASEAMAAKLLANRATVAKAVALDQIPERVTIKALSKEYEGAVMPHRKIVLSLAEGIKNNHLAANFHSQTTTLCQGCHHQGPGSVKPPQCGSCHGRSSGVVDLTRPGLLAAYHQQCIRCHEEMGLEKPATRDCTACHAKRK